MNRYERRAAKAQAKARAGEKAQAIGTLVIPKTKQSPHSTKSPEPSRQGTHKKPCFLKQKWDCLKSLAKRLYPSLKKKGHSIVFWVGFSSSLVSLFGFIFLLIDLRFQTEPSISSPASDPQNPLMFPFTITNNSHSFAVYDVTWACRLEHMQIGGDMMDNVTAIVQSESVPPIKPGQLINVDCSRAVAAPNGSINSLVLAVDINYTMYFFWIFPWKMHQTAEFTWYPQASDPQWIKGLVAD